MVLPSEPRPKQRALEKLLQRMATIRPSISDESAKVLLTDDLLRGIFEVAWQHQFDEDRSEATRQVREIVNISIDASEGGFNDH